MKLAILFGAVAARVVTVESPVTRVVELIKGLKDGIQEDGKEEQGIYDKFACWCEDTTARKAAAIDAAKDEIAELSKSIMQLKGRTATLTVDIKQVKADIADNIKSTEEARNLRNKEKEEYRIFKSNTEQARDGCKVAENILQGVADAATAHQDATQAKREADRAEFDELKSSNEESLVGMSQARTLSVVAGVRSALKLLPSDSLTDEDMKAMHTFLANPLGAPKENVAFLQNNPHGDYAPASGQILGILKNMYDTFVQNLADEKVEEERKQADYEDLMETKADELHSLEKTKVNKVATLGEDKKKLADDKTTRANTEEQLAADETFFADTKASCQQRADDWANRTRLRTEELGGIEQAIRTLEGGATTFEGSSTTFVQFNMQNVKKEKALATIKAMATKSHSLRLASLAARVKTEGHFDAVIAEVDKMITNLRQEEADDVAHRDRCEKQDNALAAGLDSLNHSKKNSEAHSERLESKSASLQVEMDKTATEIEETQAAMAAALADRNEEHDAYIKARKLDEEAVALLSKALVQLGAFYANNSKEAPPTGAFIQDPSYSEDQDAPPPAPAADYGGRKSESSGVLAILEMIKEDVRKEMVEHKKAEETAVAEFGELRSANTKTERALKNKHISLSQQKAATDQKNANVEANIEAAGASISAANGEKDALIPDCDWIRTSFDARKEKRHVEIEGLQTAKASLLGAGYEPEE